MVKKRSVMTWLFCGLMSFIFCGLSFAEPVPLVIDKNYSGSYDSGNGYLTLEAFITGTPTIVTRNSTVPMDVVFVMDYSGSMTETMGSSQTKFEAMYGAIDSFISVLRTKWDTGESNTHRVAFVGYASEIKCKSSKFYYVSDASGNNNSELDDEITRVRNITPTGGTYMHYGFDEANNLFAANSNTDEKSQATRQRIVIFLTDGVPAGTGSLYVWNSDAYNEADATVASALASKQTYNAKVYSIGLNDGAANTGAVPKGRDGVGINLTWYELTRLPRNNDSAINALSNGFLHVVSSDFPTASYFKGTSSTISNSGDYTAGYYKPAQSTASLNNIFTTISESITSVTIPYTLAGTTVLRDVMSGNFDLGLSDAAAASFSAADVVVKMVPCIAITDVDDVNTYVFGDDYAIDITSDVSVTIKPKTATSPAKIDVSGFAYSEHWVGLDLDNQPCGFKLTVTFPVHDNGTGYGAHVPTNNGESGLYTPEQIENIDNPDYHEPVVGPGNFNIPDVNIPYCPVTSWIEDIDGNLVELGTSGARGANGASAVAIDPTKFCSLEHYVFDYAQIGETIITDLSAIPVNTPVKIVYEPVAYVHHGDVDEDVRILKARGLDNKFDVTTAVEGVYSGITEGCLYAGLWTDETKTNLVTAQCGKSLDLSIGGDYYVREIPDDYLQPKVLGKYVKGKWYVTLIAAIDDPDMYKAAGFGTVDADMGGEDFSTKYVYDSVEFRYRKTATSAPTVVTINANDVITKKADTAEGTEAGTSTLTGKLICCELSDLNDYSEEALGFAPFFVTKDNVKVTGIFSRAVNTSTGTSPAWEDTETGSQTSEYSPSTQKRVMAMVPLNTFLMGEQQSDVTLTTHVNGTLIKYTLESGADANENVDIPEIDGMVFGGWYEDAEFKKAADISCITENTHIYAKMVSGEYLAVQGFSVKEDNANALVLVAAVDKSTAVSFGFKYTVNGQDYTKNITELADNYNGMTAQQLFEGVADDAKLCVMSLNLDEIISGSKIKVVSYWITKDGVKVSGPRWNMTYVSGSVEQ